MEILSSRVILRPAEYRTTNSTNHVCVIATLDLHRTNMNNCTVGNVLNLFRFGCGVYVA